MELNPTHCAILDILKKSDKTTRAVVMRAINASRSTAWKYLTDLIKAGYIEKKGTSANTYYSIVEQ